MSITDSGTPKKEERIANIIVKSFNQKKKKAFVLIIVWENYYLKPY